MNREEKRELIDTLIQIYKKDGDAYIRIPKFYKKEALQEIEVKALLSRVRETQRTRREKLTNEYIYIIRRILRHYRWYLQEFEDLAWNNTDLDKILRKLLDLPTKLPNQTKKED